VPYEREANLKALGRHFEAMGPRHLGADQVLRVTVTNVDLAGEPQPSVQRGSDLRIVRGRADWPRISLRYILESNGEVLSSGEETVADLDYTHYVTLFGTQEPLTHEKRMLDRWFRERFAAPPR
jgi:hypothetical protein